MDYRNVRCGADKEIVVMVMLVMCRIHKIKVNEGGVASITYYQDDGLLQATLFPEDLLASWFNYDEVTGELLGYSLEYRGVMLDWRFTMFV